MARAPRVNQGSVQTPALSLGCLDFQRRWRHPGEINATQNKPRKGLHQGRGVSQRATARASSETVRPGRLCGRCTTRWRSRARLSGTATRRARCRRWGPGSGCHGRAPPRTRAAKAPPPGHPERPRGPRHPGAALRPRFPGTPALGRAAAVATLAPGVHRSPWEMGVGGLPGRPLGAAPVAGALHAPCQQFQTRTQTPRMREEEFRRPPP